MHCYLLYDKNIKHEIIKKYSLLIYEHLHKHPIKKEFHDKIVDFPPSSIIFLLAGDNEIKAWLHYAKAKNFTIYIIPYASNPLTQKYFNLPPSLEELFSLTTKQHYFTYCNEKLLFSSAVIGDKKWITNQNIFLSFLKNFYNIRLFKTNIELKSQKFITASLLIEAGDARYIKEKREAFLTDTQTGCKKVAAVLYAPTSIIEALKLRYFLVKKDQKFLPKGIGTLVTDSIKLNAEKELTLICDNEAPITSKNVILKIVPTNLQIVSGTKPCPKEEKETIRVDRLPRDEEFINFYTKRTLPFLPIAPEEAFADLFKKIKDNAKISIEYTVLLLISVLMATFGLFQNSSPTIIGAMILAPLMAPVISLAMGIIRFDETLVKNSFKTVFISTLLALLLALGFTNLFPIEHMTQQMAIRTNPTLLDLGVAILAGLAAAYGYANSKVGESLAGVAIAVALVPPLCVAGIGLGWENIDVFYKAFLLYLANIIGIVFAAGIMFYLLGYASKRYASAALAIKLMLLISIFFPLYVATQTVLKEERIYEQIKYLKFKDVTLQLDNIQYHKGGATLFISVLSNKELNIKAKETILHRIKKKFPHEKLIISFKQVL
ncbi:TIGR00341 family protein [Nitratiruptor tergarcus]|uniref:TIGR00341 family protein n=1 Tax=Nitratiruptor tergarcus DSM 16512 TaxID=1069081 RepID=A0A1W1WTW0_9BACT|nr:TIGR00341 family protein [Nitratiruptor tergarcus]SMC09717.1 TIGR00341 family protein [Nitratiruptor tergarcus DSM 16512]